MIFNFILVSLGVTRLTEWVQELMPWSQKARFVSLVALVFSVGGIVLLMQDTHSWTSTKVVLWISAVWGASAVWHGIDSLLRALKEQANANWMSGIRKRREMTGW